MGELYHAPHSAQLILTRYHHLGARVAQLRHAMDPEPTPRTSSRRRASQPRQSAAPSASQDSSAPAYKPPPPSATTALDAIHELRAILEPYTSSQLNKARRKEINPFIDNIEQLIVLESAVPRAAGGTAPGSDQAGSAPVLPTDVLGPIQASVTLLVRHAIKSLGKDNKQIVKSSVDDAIKTFLRPPPPDHRPPPPAPAPRAAPRAAPCEGPKHLDVVIGLPRANQPEPFTKQKPAQLKIQVEQALEKSQVHGLAGTSI